MDWNIEPFLDWPLWGKIGAVAATIASILAIANYLLGFARRPRDEEHARRVIQHLLRNGPPRRPYGAYRAKLRGTVDAQIRSLLLECGAQPSPNRYTGIEMWGLPSRAKRTS